MTTDIKGINLAFPTAPTTPADPQKINMKVLVEELGLERLENILLKSENMSLRQQIDLLKKDKQ